MATELERRGRELNLGWCGVTRMGLVLREKPTPEQLQALGETLATMKGGLAWLVGDYLALVERLGNEAEEYKLVANEVIDHEKWTDATVRTYQWVAEKVPAENRNRDLSFNHHQLVAGLPHAEQRDWLTKAAGGDGEGHGAWSSGRLQSEMALAKSEGKPKYEYLCTVAFDQPGPRDILADEYERAGRPVSKTERAKRKREL